MQSGPQQGVIVEILQEAVLIGRSEACHIHLDDEQVSREHAAVVRKGKRLLLQDLQSRNGTQMNGRFVKEKPLKPGDVFSVGTSEIRYTDSITVADRALSIGVGGSRGVTNTPVQSIRVIHDSGEMSKFTLACLVCCLMGVSAVFAVLALVCGVAAIVDIKRRGDLRGTRLTLAACAVAMLLCSYHGYTHVWVPTIEHLRASRASYECRRNLRAIHGALARYLVDHLNAYPASLEALVPRYLKNPAYLACPQAHSPEVLPKGHAVSYTYFGHGASVTRNDAILLVDHNAMNHGARGRHVLFGDGRIEFVPEPAFANLLQKARAQVGRSNVPAQD